ncbi:MAG: ABC transporter permease subunit [Bacilli bacterium]|nr:ABC transporter permease subunit [Bacilli bacterium]
MINLIKNELIKVFRKKSIYILAAIVVTISMCNCVMLKTSDNLVNSIDAGYYKMLEEELDSYDLNNPNDLGWYISDKSSIEFYKISKDYSYDSWQYYILESEAQPNITCMVNAEVDKNDEEYNSCKSALDTVVSDVKTKDWKYFVLRDQKLNDEEIELMKQNIASASSDDKAVLELELDKLEFVKKGYEYRLKNDIPYGNSTASMIVDSYVNNGISYLSLNKDESVYQHAQLLNKREVETEYREAEYILENDISIESFGSARDIFASEASVIIFFVLIVAIMVSGSIMADEFNKGTIKQLLLRPYSRGKILASKYITSIIVFVLFAIFYFGVNYVSYGIAEGFGSYFEPIVVYDYTINAIREMNVFSYCLVTFSATIPYYLIFLTIAFALGTISGNSAVALCGSFMFSIAIEIINSFAVMTKSKFLQFLPTLCFDWSDYVFGGLSKNQYCELWSSVLVTVLTIVVIYALTYFVFKRKDIKNQ